MVDKGRDMVVDIDKVARLSKKVFEIKMSNNLLIQQNFDIKMISIGF